jgi:hypothetical protein
LNIVFADSSRFVFTSKPKNSLFPEGGDLPQGGEVQYSVGLATYRVVGLSTHASFVASHDWTKRSCGLQERSDHPR